MKFFVYLSRQAQKDMCRLPKHILLQFDLWVEIIETDGIWAMRKVNSYRDHALIGDRKGERSSSLSRSWRVIYRVAKEEGEMFVEVLEINHHDY